MRERVEAAGGRFTLTSLRGCGTTVAAVIPVPEGGGRVPSTQPVEASLEGGSERS
jgi:hypothetical protein